MVLKKKWEWKSAFKLKSRKEILCIEDYLSYMYHICAKWCFDLNFNWTVIDKIAKLNKLDKYSNDDKFHHFDISILSVALLWGCSRCALFVKKTIPFLDSLWLLVTSHQVLLLLICYTRIHLFLSFWLALGILYKTKLYDKWNQHGILYMSKLFGDGKVPFFF